MNYIWVIIGSIAAGIFTSILRWNMAYTPVYIERSNDPYVYLLGVILMLLIYIVLQRENFQEHLNEKEKTKKQTTEEEVKYVNDVANND